MTAKEIFFDFCKENGIFEQVQRRIKEYCKRYYYAPIKFLSEESFHYLLFSKGETNIFMHKLGYQYMEFNKEIDWNYMLKKWSRFKRNNILLKKPILKDGDTVEYYEQLYPKKTNRGIVSFVDLDKKKTFRCNYAVYDIGDIISVNGKPVPLDIFYIKQRGKIYGLD